MREVDQALEQAFARRGGRAHATVPPPSHLPTPGFPEPPPSARLVTLEWPPLVLQLERLHGERFQAMADALLDVKERLGHKILLITSCHRAEGRTTLTLALARALARRPGRTLLVDADLNGPMLGRQLGLRPEIGLDDVVEDGRPVADALIESPHDHLAVLPMRQAVAYPKGFLARPAWAATMSRLRREFDMVLIDGGPLFNGLGSSVPPAGTDAAVLVLNRAVTGDRGLAKATKSLAAAGVPLLGLAETFVS